VSDLVIIQNRKVVTTSLQVAETFEKEHKNVIQSIKNLAAENSATKNMFHEDTYENRGKQYPMYYMNRDGFTLLAMGFTGKKALEFKLKYIEAFNRMEQQLKELNQPSYMIDDPIKRAEKWIEEQKEKQQLQTQNLLLEQQVKEYEPKATYYDMVLQNKSLLSVSKIAKDYGMSAIKFNRLLNKLGVQYKQGDIWLLYAKYQDKGYTQTTTHVIDAERSRVSTKWTQKGRLFLYDLLKQHGVLPLIEKEGESA
jgi:Rha family phage regulatory protein